MSNQSVAIIVPTLGTRDFYLEECLHSIRSAGHCYIVLIAPATENYFRLQLHGLVDEIMIDPGNGLAPAINMAIKQLPPTIEFINWLGDDDRLTSNSLDKTRAVLDQTSCDFVWGSCAYINANGLKIGMNRSGRWAKPLLRFGPDLIPQPGALFRRNLFNLVGGLNESYRLAFDFDLFIKFSSAGKGIFVDEILAEYRWHPDALSVKSRSISVKEARLVRQSHLPSWLRLISFLWEYPLGRMTTGAAVIVNRNNLRKSLKI